jgi:hypothetical protein
MKQNLMLLSRYTGKHPMRAHNGVVITLRSNVRWCSDVFEIACSSADVVRVALLPRAMCIYSLSIAKMVMLTMVTT